MHVFRTKETTILQKKMGIVLLSVLAVIIIAALSGFYMLNQHSDRSIKK